MEQLSVIFRWLALGLLIAATVLFIYRITAERAVLGTRARLITIFAFAMLTLAIGVRPVDPTQLTGSHSTLVLLAWAMLLLYLVVDHFLKIGLYGTVLVPAAVTLLLFAQARSGAAHEGLTAQQFDLVDSWRVGIHVGLILFANAGFAVGALASAFHLIQDRQLKLHQTTGWFKRLPSLSQAQTLARKAIALAFPIYTAGILLGIIRAVETDVEGWFADPRVMMSGVAWAIFGTYLVKVYRHGISARAASWMVVAGILAVVLVSIFARTLPVGFHLFAL
ncbi:MAG: cytochrome c biogenesis protein [Actinobacteria bacterium]|nr:cytochrome c biogenesis protein [Actinomycetota bacterium]MCL5886874.1 cytochrome c biogenesis protein [Actinomycetota bacterium]